MRLPSATARFVMNGEVRRRIASITRKPAVRKQRAPEQLHALSPLSSFSALSAVRSKNFYTQTSSMSPLSSTGDSSTSNDRSMWMLAAGLAATTFMVGNSYASWSAPSTGRLPSVTLNEKSITSQNFDDDDDSQREEKEGEEEVDDPYDNLPEEDEPTHCSICNTYRQGPCRPYWRKVERCTKDHELGKENKDKKGNAEDGSKDDNNTAKNDDQPVCMKYMLPWIECASGYRGLYALIEMDNNYANGIADVESETRNNNNSLCWAPNKEPFTIDWSEWQTYVKNNEWDGPTTTAITATSASKTSPSPSSAIPQLEAQSGSANVNTKVSLWKTLSIKSSNDDPVLVPITATIPRVEDDGVGILECAYALDQYGTVLGFAYGTQGVTKTSNEDGDGNSTTDEQTDGDSSKEPVVPNVTLTIRLMPSHTSQITIGASYIRPSDEMDDKKKKESSKQKKGSDQEQEDDYDMGITRLYRSRPFSLADNGSS